MELFDLFVYLKQSQNPEAFIYRCGYYIINRNCNKYVLPHINDSFYTILDNMLLKFEMTESDDNQFFNVYKLRNFTDEQIKKLSCFTIDLEDLDSDYIPLAMNIENIKII